MENTTYRNTSQVFIVNTVPASPLTRFFGILLLITFTVASLILNLLLTVILLNGRQRYSTKPFYLLVWQFIASAYLEYIVQLTIALPITYAGKPVYDHDSELFNALAAIQYISYKGLLYFNFVLVLNRLCLFVFPRLNVLFFELFAIRYIIVAVWIFDLMTALLLRYCGCGMDFDAKQPQFVHQKVSTQPTNIQAIVITCFAEYDSLLLPPLILVMYLSIFVFMRLATRKSLLPLSTCSDGTALTKTATHQQSTQKREFEFLVQSFMIGGMLSIQNFCFQFGARVAGWIQFGSQWHYGLAYVINALNLLNVAVTPLALFLFNAEVRRRLAALFSRRRPLRPMTTSGVISTLKASTL